MTEKQVQKEERNLGRKEPIREGYSQDTEERKKRMKRRQNTNHILQR